MRTILLCLLLLGGCNQLNPTQVECTRSQGGCAPCVGRGCYWCNGVCSTRATVQCEEPIGFLQDCTDGTAPFPAPVVNPMPYGKPRHDAGARDTVAGADAR